MIITSNQSGYDSWTRILNGVFKWFQSIDNHVDLDEIKLLSIKSKEEKIKIESSYEYIGLKLMNIVRLFIRGEKFLEGKLTKDDHLAYLLQSINFITDNKNSSEFFNVNAKSFFSVVSEVFTNNDLYEILSEMNESHNSDEKTTLMVMLESIINKLDDIVTNLIEIEHLRFEYCSFILKIASSKWIKSKAKQFSVKVMDSILYILTEISNHTMLKRLNSNEHFKKDLKYIGPGDINYDSLESEVIGILSHYFPFSSEETINKIIEIASKLGLYLIKTCIYELQAKYDEWIDIFLHSAGWDPKKIFQWFKSLYKKSNELGIENVSKIKNLILNIIEDLVKIDSIKAGEVIDTWLPSSHKDVIEKLTPNSQLQLKYLQDFLKEREKDIKDCILLLHKNNRQEEACQYK